MFIDAFGFLGLSFNYDSFIDFSVNLWWIGIINQNPNVLNHLLNASFHHFGIVWWTISFKYPHFKHYQFDLLFFFDDFWPNKCVSLKIIRHDRDAIVFEKKNCGYCWNIFYFKFSIYKEMQHIRCYWMCVKNVKKRTDSNILCMKRHKRKWIKWREMSVVRWLKT